MASATQRNRARQDTISLGMPQLVTASHRQREQSHGKSLEVMRPRGGSYQLPFTILLTTLSSLRDSHNLLFSTACGFVSILNIAHQCTVTPYHVRTCTTSHPFRYRPFAPRGNTLLPTRNAPPETTTRYTALHRATGHYFCTRSQYHELRRTTIHTRVHFATRHLALNRQY